MSDRYGWLRPIGICQETAPVVRCSGSPVDVLAPVTGCHSVIDKPDSVSRVAPPTSTMAKISAATAKSHTRMAWRRVTSMAIGSRMAAAASV